MARVQNWEDPAKPVMEVLETVGPSTDLVVNSLTTTHLTVNGNATLGNAITDKVNIAGDARVFNDLDVDGDIDVVGDITSDGITATGALTGAQLAIGAATPVGSLAAIPDLAAFTDPPTAGEMATLRTTVNSILAAMRVSTGHGEILG